MRKWVRAFLVAGVLTPAVVQSADAAYEMSIASGGASMLEIEQGGSFTLDVLLSSDSGDMHNSAIFRVAFSQEGLSYDSYEWSSPYSTGSIFDDSAPFIDDLAVLLDASTLSGPGYPIDVVDVELSNVVDAGLFGDGLLATMSITVPGDFALGSVFIDVIPDTIANGFDVIDTTVGAGFELVVVPGPSAFALVVAAGLVRARRRLR